MESVIIDLPKAGCKACQFYCHEVVDHIYYGEMTSKNCCRLFDANLIGTTPCEQCKQLREKSVHEWQGIANDINSLLASAQKQSVQAVHQFAQMLAERLRGMGAVETAAMAVVYDLLEGNS